MSGIERSGQRLMWTRFFRSPVSSNTSTASGSPSWSVT
jgi:hypothetical protein